MSSYTLFFISPCVSPFIHAYSLLLLVIIYSLVCFVLLFYFIFHRGLEKLFLSAQFCFHLPYFTQQQIFISINFSKILMAELDTGVFVWEMKCHSIVSKHGPTCEILMKLIIRLHWYLICKIWPWFLLAAAYPHWIKWFLQMKMNKICSWLNRDRGLLIPVLLPHLLS